MRIAITTDWLTASGGAERVIAEMLKVWPRAPVFTTVYNRNQLANQRISASTIIPVRALQRRYAVFRSHRPLIFRMPRAVESWDIRGFDVVLSSSHAVAKGSIPTGSARHVCYCHTPMRYAWDMEEQYLDDFHLRGPLRTLMKRRIGRLRTWDRSTAKRVDLFIANSRATQERIRRIYGRESVVLHPPVDDRFFEEPLKQSLRAYQNPYFLGVGRLVPYKRFDLLIEVANRETLELKIAGEGPDGKRLRRLAGGTVEFLGHVPEADLPALYANARATIFPAHEDAGIVPLESQASGTPVIALGRGGVLDTVRGFNVRGGAPRGRPAEGIAKGTPVEDIPAAGRPDGSPLHTSSGHLTGIFFPEQTPESLTGAIQRFETMTFDPEAIREHARQFSSARFREALEGIVTTAHSAQSIPPSPVSPPSRTARAPAHRRRAQKAARG